MSLTKRELGNYLIGFAFVLLMVTAASWLNDDEIILPEIAALTTGMWIYQNQTWIRQPIKIFLAPSGTAVIGFLVNQIAINYPEKVLLTLVLILALLRVLNSTLAPAFATGLLPIIINATHWSFILAIFLFTALLMGGVLIQGHYKGLSAGQPLHLSHMLGFSLTALIWASAVWACGYPQMAGIPPVLVVFFEVSQMPNYSFKMAAKHIVALGGAATIGVLVHLLLASWLLTTLISLPLVFGLLQLLRIKLPAAYAFPLLALVLPVNMFHRLPLSAFLAAAFFLGSVVIYRQLQNRLQVATEND
ncbi:hypothetical protein FC99_GL000720 [Levilactobacillus koreensis JCM 16448]|uniref:Membrane protein n=1 Tax=Levilactobacillus koreensis TaxID=637971 RepID=A0AAC8UTY3_9LACO|nr:hypothetical protein [Levilactobacillus koreensis]AKP64098.1 membrane protein [Levilactobacillus koreensis]KRK87915.1 hypothetical protein FC99_GL000720 [Levilactobacillus koreensis JCM 16448]